MPDPRASQHRRHRGGRTTLSTVRAWKKPFAFVLNQTAIRGQRIANAATAIGDKAARELDEVLARPFIAMRNDHQER